MRPRQRRRAAARLARTRQFDNTCAGYPSKFINYSRKTRMKNPLDSLWGTVIAGVVLTVVLYVFANNFLIGG
jgi:hypothetical protein